MKNLIVIMADQLRYDVLQKGFTPHIDALLSESVRFTNAYCASPLCVPSRGAFFTGLCPNSNGSLINPWEPKDAPYGDVRASVDNLYDLMQDDWYFIHSGKQHLFTENSKLESRPESKVVWASTEKTYKAFLSQNGKRQPGLLPKFKTYIPEMVSGKVTKVSRYSNAETGCYPEDEEYYFDSYFTEMTLKALKTRDRRKPLVLSAMFLAPHPPFEIPEPWFSSVKEEDFSMPENVGVFYPHQSPLQLYNLTGIVGTRYSKMQWRRAWRVYLGLVSMLDEKVGLILDELEKQGIYDDSMIIFSSDHGEMLGSHSLFQKMCMYEESAKIPLSIRLPQGWKQVSRTVDSLVSHLDIMPTICDYFDIESKNSFEGASLRPLLEGKARKENPIFIQFDGNGARSNFQRSIIHNGFKLIVDIFKDEEFYELYHIAEDPMETTNLAFHTEFDDILRSLSSSLDEHMRATGDLITLRPMDPDTFRSLYGDFRA